MSDTPDKLPLERFLRRQRMVRTAVCAVVVVAAVALAVADYHDLLLDHRTDFERYDGQIFRVIHVVDGDTLHIAEPNGRRDPRTGEALPYTVVRLWGIDTPEVARPAREKPAEPYAHEATAFARALVEGRSVRLTLQPHRVRGTFGRLLAYVETGDGIDLSAALLDAGLAEAVDAYEHDREADYAARAKAAQAAGIGLWSQE